MQTTGSIEVEQLPGDVLDGDLEIMSALTIAQSALLDPSRLSVDEPRAQGAGIASEQRVGERAIAPEEAL